MLTSALSLIAAAAVVHGAALSKRADSITDYTSSPASWSYPSSRGFNAATASQYSCGGIAAPSTRQDYPLTGGQVVFESQTFVSNVNMLLVNNSNPTTFHEFSTFSNTILDMSKGSACMEAPDFGAMGWTAGTPVTLLAIYQLYGNDTYFYQCADINLVETSSYTAPSYSCSNTSAIFAVASDDDSMVLAGSNYAAAQAGIDGQTVALVAATAAGDIAAATVTVTPTAVASSSSSSGLPAAAGGGIGAGVTIAVIGLLLAFATFSGVISLGRKHGAAKAHERAPSYHSGDNDHATTEVKGGLH
ncbi:hypothetical protein JCM8097_004743 [Rhodosporidiobolus ruineniae]